MGGSYGKELRVALARLVFPVVPALLEDTYYQCMNLASFARYGPDPRDWDGFRWLKLAGPLLGFGFLAGATLDLPDDPSRRGVRGWLARRSLWVAFGPWLGGYGLIALWLVISGVNTLLNGRVRQWLIARFEPWQGTWASEALPWVVYTMLSYGWLIVAIVALRRAGRLGRWGRALRRGVGLAPAFTGSLFGSFWAITEVWRSYFFDPRVVSMILAALSLGVLSGCATTVTVGEVRCRDLFHAMLMAWMLGLAIAWRWWSRPRSGPPGVRR
jgi:hypothetical protein